MRWHGKFYTSPQISNVPTQGTMGARAAEKLRRKSRIAVVAL